MSSYGYGKIMKRSLNLAKIGPVVFVTEGGPEDSHQPVALNRKHPVMRGFNVLGSVGPLVFLPLYLGFVAISSDISN